MVYAYELVFFYEDSYLHFDVFFCWKVCSLGIDRIKYGCKDEEMEDDDYFFQYDKSPW